MGYKYYITVWYGHITGSHFCNYMIVDLDVEIKTEEDIKKVSESIKYRLMEQLLSLNPLFKTYDFEVVLLSWHKLEV